MVKTEDTLLEDLLLVSVFVGAFASSAISSSTISNFVGDSKGSNSGEGERLTSLLERSVNKLNILLKVRICYLLDCRDLGSNFGVVLPLLDGLGDEILSEASESCCFPFFVSFEADSLL